MFRKIAPHILMIMSLMYMVFFVIDRINSAMAFINNDITKVLLFIQCILTIVLSIVVIASDRRRGN